MGWFSPPVAPAAATTPRRENSSGCPPPGRPSTLVSDRPSGRASARKVLPPSLLRSCRPSRPTTVTCASRTAMAVTELLLCSGTRSQVLPASAERISVPRWPPTSRPPSASTAPAHSEPL